MCIQRAWYFIILVESLCMVVSSKSIQTQMIIQYALEGFLSPIILSAFPKETEYINTPYHKWNQSQHPPHCIFYRMLFHNMTCSSSLLINTVTPNIDLAISCAFFPFHSHPVIAISLFLCLNKSLCFFLEYSFFLITVCESKM